MATDTTRTGINLALGIPIAQLPDGAQIVGHVDEDEVLLLRHGQAFYAVSPYCTHYHGELANGMVVDGSIRCPLHHACFDLATGEALRAPALDPIRCWRVEVDDNRVYVREQLPRPSKPRLSDTTLPSSIVIVGGGAAGLAAAEMLRRSGYEGRLTLLDADAFPPCDRPNLSKDYLAGTAPEEWIPLRATDFYVDNQIDLRLDREATALDPLSRTITLSDGEQIHYDKALIATGSDPIYLDIPGARDGSVRYLRSQGDAKRLVDSAAEAKRALIMGASFIGLEVAASLRHRGIEVHVVGRDPLPMERVLGSEFGKWIKSLHEAQGVIFHLGTTVSRVESGVVNLESGQSLGDFDLLIAGVGVRPSVSLAEQAGLATDRGVLVDPYLRTSAPDVFAAGDIARWPDPHTGECIRVEHWTVAQTQGQFAALNMLGHKQPYRLVPFFWSQHYDTIIRYVGHAERWDRIEIGGSIEQKDVVARYFSEDRLLAVATIGRDAECLSMEIAMECNVARPR